MALREVRSWVDSKGNSLVKQAMGNQIRNKVHMSISILFCASAGAGRQGERSERKCFFGLPKVTACTFIRNDQRTFVSVQGRVKLVQFFKSSPSLS